MGNTSKTQTRLAPGAFLQHEHGFFSDHNQEDREKKKEDREALKKKGHRGTKHHDLQSQHGGKEQAQESPAPVPLPSASPCALPASSEARAQGTEI